MTSETQHAPPGSHRSGPPVRDGGGTVRSGKTGEQPARTASGAAAGSPEGRRARGDRRIVGVIPYLAVLVAVAAGVYIAWRQGSAGGGRGGAIAGAALLAGAVVRMALPGRLAGLLASRHRVTDVLTLAVFGAGLLVAGLVLPRLGPLSAQGRMAGPPMKGKHE
jgi:Protein of unknown function (DUF3017)